MELENRVLALLEAGGGPVSGEEIAVRLDVSRNAVWKAVEKLRKQGYGIEAGTNRGYELVSQSGALNAENIRRRLEGAAKAAMIDVRESVGSTNDVLKEAAEAGGREGTVLIARRQTAGKGRLGRSFYSPRDDGLYLSILLRPRFSAEESLSITTAAAVAVAGAVEEVTGRQAGIKWVNDVYLDGYKICGILTEASVDFESGGLHYAVLGIGVNLREPEGGFPEELKDVAGALYPGEPPKGAWAGLAAGILNRFFRFYGSLTDRPFLEEYRRRSLLTGMEITFTRGRETSAGTVLGIDEQARLVVRLDSGEETAFSAGEVNIDKEFLTRLREREKDEIRV